MAAIVHYKKSKLVTTIPVSWIYNYDEYRDQNTFISYYHENKEEIAPSFPSDAVRMNIDELRENNKFYKVYVKSLYGKLNIRNLNLFFIM